MLAPIGKTEPVVIFLERATTEVSFFVSFPPDWLNTVFSFVYFLENSLRFPISFVVSIVRSAPVGEALSVLGWLK